MYMEGIKPTIRLNKIGRDGKGTDYSVSKWDTGVFRFMAALCCIYPSIIGLDAGNGFIIRNMIAFLSVKEYVIYQSRRRNSNSLGLTSATINGSNSPGVSVWRKVTGDERVLRDYQDEALAELKENDQHGHIIWIDVGMGKTLIVMSYLKYLLDKGNLPPYVVYTLPTSAIDSIVKEMTMFGFPYLKIDMRVKPESGTSKILQPGLVNLVPHDHMRMHGLDEQMRTIASNMFFICDEFHLCLSSKTIRTSLALEISKLSYRFIAMSGTILNDAVEDLMVWLEQVVPYPVTSKNYFAAVGSLIAKSVGTGILVERVDYDIPMPPNFKIQYDQYVPEKLGGTAVRININEACKICYEVLTPEMVSGAINVLNAGRMPFIVAKDIAHQEAIQQQLVNQGVKPNTIHLITRDTPITLTPSDTGPIKVVITTIKHSAGYTVTKMNVMITSVYFSNESTREQLEGRINRIGQNVSPLYIATYHTGLLSYIYNHYKRVRNISSALKGFAKEVGDVELN